MSRLKMLQQGERVTLVLTDIHEEPYLEKGTVEEAPVQHGYYPKGSPGTWSNANPGEWEESYRIAFRKKGHQRPIRIRVEEIKEIRPGW